MVARDGEVERESSGEEERREFEKRHPGRRGLGREEGFAEVATESPLPDIVLRREREVDWRQTTLINSGNSHVFLRH